MRTLLFVSVKGARPKCYGSVAPTCEDELVGEEWSGHTERQYQAAHAEGAHYWVVECADANAGRRLIAMADCEARGGHYFGHAVPGPDHWKVDSYRPCRCGLRMGEVVEGRIIAVDGKAVE